MNKGTKVVVVGLGEVGKPLMQLASEFHQVVGIDISPPPEDPRGADVLHLCFPFQIRDFVGEAARYIGLIKPALTVINSTVEVGTTRKVAEASGSAVVYSPVRGKHARMLEDLRKYTKFIGGLDQVAAAKAASHFESLGLKTRILSSPEAAEVAKLTETTYFGLMIAWAQQVERYADRVGVGYDEITSFYDEIGFFPPVKYFPGIIGGHCVMPNIELLKRLDHSEILDAIQASNRLKVNREDLQDKSS
jgi:UDP-N-acetyl-D-mannosaminuronate dehydrogenase